MNAAASKPETATLKVASVKARKSDSKKGGNLRKARIYIFLKGESVYEQLVNRHSRPHDAYRILLPEVLERIGVDPEAVKLSWSQRAGCSCGCSPGFVVDGLYGFDVFVDVVAE